MDIEEVQVLQVKNLYEDALHISDVLIKRYATVSVIGRSLGSVIATHLVSRKDIDKFILVTPFDNIQKVAQARFPIYPMSVLIKDKYDSFSKVRDIKAKTLAQNDEVIPLKNSQNLIDVFLREQVTVTTILDSGHNDLSENKHYYNGLHDKIEGKWSQH